MLISQHLYLITMRTVFWVIAGSILLSFMPAPAPQTVPLVLHFTHHFQQHALQLDTVLYKNDRGQSFSISKFKYYIGQICLTNTNGKAVVVDEYFLIDEEEITSQSVSLAKIPKGEYDTLRFMIGVDSVYNCSGAQSGALDPIHGMFWSWNSGYIFLKLEGNAQSCNTPLHLFEYHIGGFTKDNNSIRTITLPLKNKLIIGANATATIHIRTSVDEVLKNPNSLDFAVMPSVTDHKNASVIADNYADIFSITSITYEK